MYLHGLYLIKPHQNLPCTYTACISLNRTKPPHRPTRPVSHYHCSLIPCLLLHVEPSDLVIRHILLSTFCGKVWWKWIFWRLAYLFYRPRKASIFIVGPIVGQCLTACRPGRSAVALSCFLTVYTWSFCISFHSCKSDPSLLPPW